MDPPLPMGQLPRLIRPAHSHADVCYPNLMSVLQVSPKRRHKAQAQKEAEREGNALKG